jgi:hypothetical protein
MFNKILCFILLGVFVGLAPVGAQTTPADASAKVKGRIIAARVDGLVNAVSKADGQSRALHDGDQISDQTQVITSEGANVILVFSNGASVNVAADSTLDIDEFVQDPFASDLKVSDMKEEPGTSVTRLNIVKGELVGKVVHLNVDKGSEFTVNTPVGAAGIRGTTFRIVFRPDPRTGKAFFLVTTTEGTVVYRGITSGPVSIPAGKQVVATFDYTAPSATSPGSTAQSTPVTITTTNVSFTEASQIQTASQAIVTAVENTVIPSSGSGNAGTGGQQGGGNNNANTTTTTTNNAATTTNQQPINPTVVSPSG